MRKPGDRVCVLCMSVLVAVVLPGASWGTARALPQDGQSAVPLSTPIDPDSFLTAPNDSVEAAMATANTIREEEASLWDRIRNSGLGQLYIKGGVFMHPLLACSIIGLVLCIERLWTLSRARSNTRKLMLDVIKAIRGDGVEAAMVVCQNTRGPVAAVLHSGLLRAHRGAEAAEKAITTSGAIELAFLERGLTILAAVSNVAPLLGFLGTVSGMISAFAAIAAAEQVSARLVAKGIEEALITTAAGLMIAVPISIFYSFFVVQIDRFVIEMEETSTELVDELLDIEYRKGKPLVDRA